MARAPEAARIVKAALAYAAIVFAVGFVFGTLRTLVLAPWLGALGAVLAEVPFIPARARPALGAATKVAAPAHSNAAVIPPCHFALRCFAITRLTLVLSRNLIADRTLTAAERLQRIAKSALFSIRIAL